MGHNGKFLHFSKYFKNKLELDKNENNCIKTIQGLPFKPILRFPSLTDRDIEAESRQKNVKKKVSKFKLFSNVD